MVIDSDNKDFDSPYYVDNLNTLGSLRFKTGVGEYIIQEGKKLLRSLSY